MAKASKGSAVFETVGDQVQVGTVVERLLSNGFRVVSSGVLELAEGDGQRTRLTFGADDLVVSFAVLVRVRMLFGRGM